MRQGCFAMVAIESTASLAVRNLLTSVVRQRRNFRESDPGFAHAECDGSTKGAFLDMNSNLSKQARQTVFRSPALVALLFRVALNRGFCRVAPAVFAFLLATFAAHSAFAVEPDEILADPELEARARQISGQLRCLICRNENIDNSNAELAADLRVFVRERLVAGDTDSQVFESVVQRYGEYVLLNPRLTGSSVVLWFAGPLAFLVAFGLIGKMLARRSRMAGPAGLSDEETSELRRIVDG